MLDSHQPLAGRRILVVEDEFLIAMEIQRWLHAAGAEVVGPVPTVSEALSLIDGGHLDAAVLDVNLGDGDTSYPVADRLAVLGIPHLFATGETGAAEARDYGDRPRREKPFVQDDLIGSLRDLIR